MARWLSLFAMLAAAWVVTLSISPSGDPVSILLGFGLMVGLGAICYFVGRASGFRAVSEGTVAAVADARRSRWQFTLRELFLVMIALSLFMALVVSSRGFKQTPFFTSFSGDAIAKAACSRLGLEFRAPSHQSKSCSGTSPPVSNEMRFEVESPPASESGRVIAGMQQEIRRLVQEKGFTLNEVGYSGSLPANLVDFSFGYEQGATAGKVRVYSVPGKGTTWTLFILLDEFRK